MSSVKSIKNRVRCAVYTRKSSEEGLEQEFNSLHAQREACEAYIQSQRHEGWQLHPDSYDDGGFSGGNIKRPALTRIIEDIKQGLINIIIVYKVDRLSRSLSDFVQMINLFDEHSVSFVSVTQQFNTSTSMGRLTLNVLLSFAQFEREVTGERIREKIAASVKKGMWMGGVVPLGYENCDRKLIVNDDDARTVRHIFQRYLELKNVKALKAELDREGYVTRLRISKSGKNIGGGQFYRGSLYTILKNPIYIGKLKHHDKVYDGRHHAIIEQDIWDRAQQQLEDNRIDTTLRTHAKQPSLLAGLLFDDNNNVMSPSHTKRKEVRHRYYVSQALLQYREKEAGSVTRISASTIENLVHHQIKSLLNAGTRLAETLSLATMSATEHERLNENATSLAKDWCDLEPHKQINHLKCIIQKITVSSQEVQIIFSRSGLATTLLPETKPSDISESDEYPVTIQVALKRCGIEKRLIIADAEVPIAHHLSVQAIQNALSKALEWNHALMTGSSINMTEIADKNGVMQRYVGQLIKLAWLAPDIMQSIFRGNIPAELSLRQLKKGFPLDWTAQRASLGFS